MKTKILSLILMFVAISGLSNSTFAASKNNSDFVVLRDIKAINRIEVRGNVELFISDNSTEQVKVYNQYYSESALVQSNNGVLRITSYNDKKLIVWVSANDLRSVAAYDNAEVKSFGKFSNIEFSVELHNNATASLDLNVYSANVTLRDSAKVELSGTATEFGLNRNSGSIVTKNNFVADHSTDNDNKIASAEVKNDDIVAGLE